MKLLPWLCYLLALVVLLQCKSDIQRSNEEIKQLTGKELSKKYCASCHLYPQPDQLDKNTWHQFVLPRMAAFMGIYTDGRQYFDTMPDQWIEPGEGGERVRRAHIYPKKPILSREEWTKIFDYYVQKAPSKLSRTYRSEIKLGIPGFESKPFLTNSVISPLIQSVTFDSKSKRIYLAEMEGGLFTYSSEGRLVNTFRGERFIVDMRVEGTTLKALDMGSRIASDNPKGSYLDYDLEGKVMTEESRISSLMRPVAAVEGQLDDDDDQEIVICEFGNLLGQISVYDPEQDSLKLISLNIDDGYVSVELADMNQDGTADIVALQGNSNEGIDIFWNEGDLQFRRERVLTFQPTSGSTHMNLVDYNQDGKLDILYCSGDNGDYTPINKPYHGIYIYLSEGLAFKQSLFLPMNGVYQAEAQDFDQDGDLDIVAVAFHPDFINSPRSSFQYFENKQNQFESYTVSQYNHARWMRFMVEDIDMDDDMDILLTAMNIKTPDVPADVASVWRSRDLPVLLIENQLNK